MFSPDSFCVSASRGEVRRRCSKRPEVPGPSFSASLTMTEPAAEIFTQWALLRWVRTEQEMLCQQMGGMGRRSGFSFKKFEPCLGDVGAVPESSFAKGLDMQMGIIEHITGIE